MEHAETEQRGEAARGTVRVQQWGKIITLARGSRQNALPNRRRLYAPHTRVHGLVACKTKLPEIVFVFKTFSKL